MSSFLRTSIVPRLILATLLAGGALTVWGVVVGTLHSTYIDARAGLEVNELVRITRSGHAVIEMWRYKSHDPRLTYDLERHPANLAELEPQLAADQSRTQDNYYVRGHSLPTADRYQHWMVHNRFAIRGLNTGGMPETSWFLCADRETPDHAYLVEYDRRSNQCAGYIGVGGFRLEKPSLDEQFAIGKRSLNVASEAEQSVWGRAMSFSGDRTPLLIISDDKLYAVDLQFAAPAVMMFTPGDTDKPIRLDRTVRQIPLGEPVVSMNYVTEPTEAPDGKSAERRVIVRTAKHVMLIDMQGNVLRSAEIPADLEDEYFSAFLPAGDEIVFEYDRGRRDTNDSRVGLTWVNTKTGAARSEVVAMRVRQVTTSRVAWTAATIAPSPAVLAVTFYELIAVIRDPILPPADVAARRAEIWNASWSPLLVVSVLSASAALIAYRRQKRYAARGAIAWAIFVFITGPAGLLGYLWHRRWPVVERCASCHARAPRDRGDCLRCHTEFPAPKQLGCEVFA